jgi:hypothetical protein
VNKVNKILYRATSIAGVITTLIFSANPAYARNNLQKYKFVKIADISGKFKNFNNDGPALNNSGVVTWPAILDNNTVGIYTGKGQAPTQITNAADGFTGVGYSDINNDGHVVFQASKTDGSGIYIKSGKYLHTLATASPSAEFKALLTDPVINNQGKVVFIGTNNTGGAGVYLGAYNQSMQTVAHTDSTFYDLLGTPWEGSVAPDVNDNGMVVFHGVLNKALPSSAPEYKQICGGDPTCFPGKVRSLFVRSHKGLKSIVNNKGSYLSFTGSPVITSSGVVYYLFRGDATNPKASNNPQDAAYRGFNKYQEGKNSLVVDNLGGFARFGYLAANNAGKIAFNAIIDAVDAKGHLIEGLYTGNNPKTHKIIDTTDSLDGKKIASDFPNGPHGLVFYHKGLNDRGQITFLVHFADGTEALYRADPRL